MDQADGRPHMKAFLALLIAAVLAAVLVCAALTAACGGGGSTPGTTATTPGPDTTAGASTSLSAPATTSAGTETTAGTGSVPAAPGVVTFTTEDGLTLSGHLYGSGRWGVVLAHMYPSDQTSWSAVAERLAQEGYLVLTFDFRGYGESEGSKDIQHLDRDVFAAALYLRNAGASDIVLVGASMGGTASLVAASTLQTMSSLRLAGVATLSAPASFKGLSAQESVPQLVVPLLFIAAQNDVGAEGARNLQELSAGKGDLQIVPGSEHGTELFSGEQADTVWQLLTGFLQQTLEVGGL
jgi:pimeloyl-ACP methyl ester carboxylesterase